LYPSYTSVRYFGRKLYREQIKTLRQAQCDILQLINFNQRFILVPLYH
jgi:hypothetical protein